jgi:glutaredoxin
MSAVVTLYGRPGCCLCDEARELLEGVRARRAFTFVERDIEQDPELHRRYLERIPVVTIDGEEAFEYIVDEARLEALLAGAEAPSARPDPSAQGRSGPPGTSARPPQSHV